MTIECIEAFNKAKAYIMEHADYYGELVDKKFEEKKPDIKKCLLKWLKNYIEPEKVSLTQTVKKYFIDLKIEYGAYIESPFEVVVRGVEFKIYEDVVGNDVVDKFSLNEYKNDLSCLYADTLDIVLDYTKMGQYYYKVLEWLEITDMTLEEVVMANAEAC
jgi:hypothetical protein